MWHRLLQSKLRSVITICPSSRMRAHVTTSCNSVLYFFQVVQTYSRLEWLKNCKFWKAEKWSSRLASPSWAEIPALLSTPWNVRFLSFLLNLFTKIFTIKLNIFLDDFKPASVDVQKMAKVEVGQTHDITVTVPNIEGSAVEHTVFRGNQKPYQKECVLIIDNNTGEITLERLNTNIQVKKTR